MYAVEITARGRRSLKNLPLPLKEKIIAESRKLSEIPKAGIPLKAPFQGMLSYHFNYKGVEYRLAYHVENEQEKVIVHPVAPPENFYKILRRSLKI